MLETLISSKTRIRLLLKFFLNPQTGAHLRGLAEEFEESTNSVRVELNRLESAGMLETSQDGNKKIFKVNQRFPLFQEVRSIVLKQTGLDRVVEEVIENLGDLNEVYLTGELAQGRNSSVVSLIFIGDPDRTYLTELVIKAEPLINKKIQYLIYSKEEFESIAKDPKKLLLLWHES
ncbi:MAG: ArsR family transcriptional regulator [Roseivirga sp.]|uniref:ArsR family transcriptional regulator n=1 Tax=Roseivirga sp. TaxID=1964215 RepID=UPI001B07FD1C|nr:ArsR family transcriptional regulator [Roseivirga sp.]MBO6660991.1 ArsR family transcriptional regulator [Roseivirga sp.]MBO6761087.1 ArsR family transcriptional regulator [Roseivirga sp.]MBO6909025.1 ArsR family transcriptional regulator [Roseivirga sp.]